MFNIKAKTHGKSLVMSFRGVFSVGTFLSAFMGIFFIAACSHQPEKPIDNSENSVLEASVLKEIGSKETVAQNHVVLTPSEKVVYQDIMLEFLEVVDDSRCPKTVQCVWAGNAKVLFLLSHGESAQTLELNTIGNDSMPRQVVEHGIQITLLSLKPEPAENIRINPYKYQATLEIVDAPKNDGVKDLVIIDVRSDEEFSQGHYSTATHIPHAEITQKIGALNLDKNQPIMLYCRSGRRAGVAQEALQKLGYTNVTNAVNLENLEQILQQK